MVRQIILDTETTGLDPKQGHRIIEIGGIEVVNKVKTGRVFHYYINPERDVPAAAYKVHGISTEFLKDKPKFAEIAQSFIDFVGDDSQFVIHNAMFDMKFINHELAVLGHKTYPFEKALDTLMMARKKFPGSPASLDALCKRFNVSLKDREDMGHGALLDSELLYKVYVCLSEGMQSTLFSPNKKVDNNPVKKTQEKNRVIESRDFNYPEDFLEYKKFISNIENSLWEKTS